jgi:hypothetical protein
LSCESLDLQCHSFSFERNQSCHSSLRT